VASKNGTSRGVAERYYKVMKPEEIYNLSVGALSDNAVLFLWATYPNIEVALQAIRE